MKSTEDDPKIHGLLVAWNKGDDEALARLLEICYQTHLVPRARAILKNDRRGRYFSPGDLIHQAWFSLNQLQKRHFPNLGAWLGFVRELMRRALIDFARKEDAAIRGGKKKKVISIENCQKWLNG